MNERLTYWECRECFGTGRVIVASNAYTCFACDGSGNALVSGAKHRHVQRLAEIDRKARVNGDI